MKGGFGKRFGESESFGEGVLFGSGGLVGGPNPGGILKDRGVVFGSFMRDPFGFPIGLFG